MRIAPALVRRLGKWGSALHALHASELAVETWPPRRFARSRLEPLVLSMISGTSSMSGDMVDFVDMVECILRRSDVMSVRTTVGTSSRSRVDPSTSISCPKRNGVACRAGKTSH